MILLERPNEVEIEDQGSDEELTLACRTAGGFSGVTRSGGRIFLTFQKGIDTKAAFAAIALSRIPTEPPVQT